MCLMIDNLFFGMFLWPDHSITLMRQRWTSVTLIFKSYNSRYLVIVKGESFKKKNKESQHFTIMANRNWLNNMYVYNVNPLTDGNM